MDKKIVFLGCGSANLFAALYMIDKGYKPSLITIIDAGGEPATRSSMLKGFAGAGLKSDGKFVFSLHNDPLSDHMTDNEKRGYHEVIQRIMERYVAIDPSGVSNPVPSEELHGSMCKMIPDWDTSGMDLKQSTVWHIGTDTELVMACAMYDHMVEIGVNMLLNHNAVDIDFDCKTVYCKNRGNHVEVTYDHLQVGVGKSGVQFVEQIVDKFSIPIESGFANVGGRFETKCNPVIQRFADDIQYDFKFYKEYTLPSSGIKIGVRTFCTCNYSAYVMEEGIEGVRTYNGHAYGKHHEKWNGMTNFGVIARIHGVNASLIHRQILSKHGKGGCAVRGACWDGESTIDKVADSISWLELADLYSGVGDNDMGRELVFAIRKFISYIGDLLDIKGNYSFYVPEIKMAAGVIKTDRSYSLSDGRYPDVTWVGDSCTGSVGIVPAAMTGMRGVERYLHSSN